MRQAEAKVQIAPEARIFGEEEVRPIEVRPLSIHSVITQPTRCHGPKVHPLVLKLFPQREVNIPFGGRLKHFVSHWKKVTNDREILKMIQGWEIKFSSPPITRKTPNIIRSRTETETIGQEISTLLKKGAIEKTHHVAGQVISSLFLREKKDGSLRPILNLKGLNEFIPYEHFKMEGLKDVKNLMKKNDWFIKIDLKDAYFSLPLSPKSGKYVRFLWEGIIYQFLCLCFGLGPAPRLFTKLMKIPISILRRINIRLVIFLDDLLIFGSSMEEILMARDTVIYLLEGLGFVINYNKSIITPTTSLEYLGIVVDSTSMTMSLTEAKSISLTKLCQKTLISKKLSLRKLGSLIGKLVATAPAVTPCMLQVRYLQQLQIQSFKKHQNYEKIVIIDENSMKELEWWVENLHITKGKPIKTSPQI